MVGRAASVVSPFYFILLEVKLQYNHLCIHNLPFRFESFMCHLHCLRRCAVSMDRPQRVSSMCVFNVRIPCASSQCVLMVRPQYFPLCGSSMGVLNMYPQCVSSKVRNVCPQCSALMFVLNVRTQCAS